MVECVSRGYNWGHVIDALERAKKNYLVKKVKEKIGVLPVVDAKDETVDGKDEVVDADEDEIEMVDVN